MGDPDFGLALFLFHHETDEDDDYRTVVVANDPI